MEMADFLRGGSGSQDGGGATAGIDSLRLGDGDHGTDAAFLHLETSQTDA